MAKINPLKKVGSMRVRKKLGIGWELGEIILGEAICGNEGIIKNRGTENEEHIEGIYRKRGKGKTAETRRENFMMPSNPRTENQQANRQKLADAVLAWRNLTDEQKAVWNKKAIGLKATGYNLFVGNYILTH